MTSKRLSLVKAAPSGAHLFDKAHEYISQSSLSRQMVDMVYLRVSQINGCAYCVDMHSHDLEKAGMAKEKMRLIPVWRESENVFDQRERAALAWSESLTLVAKTHAPDADYAAAYDVFGERELADLTIAIALMNALNRLGVGLRMAPQWVRKILPHESDKA